MRYQLADLTMYIISVEAGKCVTVFFEVLAAFSSRQILSLMSQFASLQKRQALRI